MSKIMRRVVIILAGMAVASSALAASSTWGSIHFYNSGDGNNASAKVNVDNGGWNVIPNDSQSHPITTTTGNFDIVFNPLTVGSVAFHCSLSTLPAYTYDVPLVTDVEISNNVNLYQDSSEGNSHSLSMIVSGMPSYDTKTGIGCKVTTNPFAPSKK